MRRRRIVHAGAGPGARLELAPADVRHLALVLRLPPGAELEVSDGAGARWAATYLGETAPQVEVLGQLPPPAPPEPVTVALASVKGARMDWAAEKLSELGVRSLVPLLSARGQTPPRLDRLRRIAAESAKQCGRGTLLAVSEPLTLAALAEQTQDGASKLVLDPAGEALRSSDVEASPVVLVIGPEGGLTDDERSLARGLGFRSVRIAATVLRSETAAVAGAAAVIALRGSAQ